MADDCVPVSGEVCIRAEPARVHMWPVSVAQPQAARCCRYGEDELNTSLEELQGWLAGMSTDAAQEQAELGSYRHRVGVSRREPADRGNGRRHAVGLSQPLHRLDVAGLARLWSSNRTQAAALQAVVEGTQGCAGCDKSGSLHGHSAPCRSPGPGHRIRVPASMPALQPVQA